MAYTRVNWENGNLVKNGYVLIDGVETPTVEPTYDGNTPINSINLNNMDKGIHDIDVATRFVPTTNSPTGIITCNLEKEIADNDIFYLKIENTQLTTDEDVQISVDNGTTNYTLFFKDNTPVTKKYLRDNGICQLNIIFDGTHFTLNRNYQKILWEGKLYMQDGQEAVLSENIDKQENGIVLVFSAFKNNLPLDAELKSFFVSKKEIELLPSKGHSFVMHNANFSRVATKYLYIDNDKIRGYQENVGTGNGSGITYNNKNYVMRYVIGV